MGRVYHFSFRGIAFMRDIAGIFEERIRDHFGTIGSAGNSLRDLPEERDALGGVFGALYRGTRSFSGRKELLKERGRFTTSHGAIHYEIQIFSF